MPDRPKHPHQWRFSAQVTAGFFRQHAGANPRPLAQNREGGRLNFQAQLTRHQLGKGLLDLRRVRLHARQSIYNGGREFTVLGLGWGKFWHIGPVRIGAERFDNLIGGGSPFFFDRPELRHEWRPSLRIVTGGWEFEYNARIDGERGGLFNQVFSLRKRCRCLSPRITYRTRRQEIGIELSFVGLSDQRPVRTSVADAGRLDDPGD